jgi:hypothetical protein
MSPDDKDASAIAQMTAEDYVYVGPNGAVLDQAAIPSPVTPPTGLRAARTRIIVVMLGEGAALVRHRWQGTGTFRIFVDDHRCVTIPTFKRSMAHSIRAVLGYWCVSATGSLRDRDARLANPAFLQTNADDFGSTRRDSASHLSVPSRTPSR